MGRSIAPPAKAIMVFYFDLQPFGWNPLINEHGDNIQHPDTGETLAEFDECLYHEDIDTLLCDKIEKLRTNYPAFTILYSRIHRKQQWYNDTNLIIARGYDLIATWASYANVGCIALVARSSHTPDIEDAENWAQQHIKTLTSLLKPTLKVHTYLASTGETLFRSNPN
ncbi:MAG: hypothetical protein AAF125_01210 [Chloroflexota bacterium]